VNRTRFCFALVTALALSSAPTGHGNEVVEIQLRGHYFAEPATVQITVAVEPAEANRMLRIEADGETYYRASELTLSGAEDQRLHSLVFKNLPAGAYMLRAEVFSTDTLLGQATQELFVTGTGGR
jgi:hypothetical protein